MRQCLFGLYFDNVTMDETVVRVTELIADGSMHQHVVINASKVVQAHHDHAVRDIINACDLINVDGMGVVWASYVLGKPIKERVTGIDLFERLLQESVNQKWRVYFLGATAAVMERLTETIQAKYPALDVCGSRNGYWAEEEEDGVVFDIAQVRPHILFVGIPSPKKEIFLSRHLKKLRVPFVMGVGGTFDVIAGKVKRAPRFLQRMGLEWFWRFMHEPRRLWRRYFLGNIRFVQLVAQELIRQRIRKSKGL